MEIQIILLQLNTDLLVQVLRCLFDWVHGNLAVIERGIQILLFGFLPFIFLFLRRTTRLIRLRLVNRLIEFLRSRRRITHHRVRVLAVQGNLVDSNDALIAGGDEGVGGRAVQLGILLLYSGHFGLQLDTEVLLHLRYSLLILNLLLLQLLHRLLQLLIDLVNLLLRVLLQLKFQG